MSTQRGYKLRSYVNGTTKSGKEYRNYSLTVPNDIAEALPEGMTFIPRMTEDGLLYEPARQSSGVELPAWAKESSNGGVQEAA